MSHRPTWLNTLIDIEIHDARPEIAAGGHPVERVMAALQALPPGGGYGLVSPFVPDPLVEKARMLGCEAYTEERGPEDFLTTFHRPA